MQDDVVDKITQDIWSPFTKWQFAAACLVIMILIMTIKKIAKQSRPKLLSTGWFQSTLTVLNLAFGAALAIPNGFLYGSSYFQRCLVGVIAGGLNHILYHALIKRVAIALGMKSEDLDLDDDKSTAEKSKSLEENKAPISLPQEVKGSVPVDKVETK